MRAPLLTTILASIALAGCQKGEWTDTSMCLDVPDDTTECPAQGDVDLEGLTNFGWCSADVRELTGPGTISENPLFPDTGGGADLYCCYPAVARDADPGCVVGRPFFEGGTPTTAPVRPGDSWSAAIPGPAADGVDWEGMARMEHASVASFAKLTLDLLALGAPPSLLAAVQQAAADEIEHARLCFGMLARSGTALEPGPMAFQPIVPCADAAAVAYATVREGCLGETMGAWLADHAAAGCDDPAARGVLARIAADEARHAALSWEIVAWLLRTGGPEVRDAVQRAFAEPFAVVPPVGLASDAAVARWVDAAQAEVLAPAVRALLAA
ncbi:MAG: hypothetical protein H6737_21225 [Alphaproteobacteria bacterium]|nr:hypothetical protein [Alphaproteobacteria bacterium]